MSLPPARVLQADVVLRDGSTAHVRPVTPADVDDLRRFLEALSPESRWFRFFTAGALLDRAAAEAASVDGTDRLGLLALSGEEPRLVGHAEYVRSGPDRAEIAFEVADDHRGLGLATILLAHLAHAARRHGISTFTATVLATNHRMVEVFRDSGFPLSVRSGPGELTVELATSPTDSARDAFHARERTAATAAVRTVLEPASVALIGASSREGTIGAALARNLLAGGFTGPLHLVNRRDHRVAGLDVHRSILDVPGSVELAVVAVPAQAVLEVAHECAAKGVRSLVVISAGFAETGADGAERQRDLLSLCRATGMRLVGPNCLGVLSTPAGLNATFAPTAPRPGSVAVSSQSGGVGIALLEQADALGLGLSAFASIGNRADLSPNDLLQFWEQDPHTALVLLYLESFGNPRRFARIARRVAASKPVLAVKAGRSAAGARAAGSHTGALLRASDVTVDALFRQAGVVRADTLGELFDVATLLAGQPLPEGRSVAIVTNAGGPGILAADACAANGLEVPELSPGTQRELRSFAGPGAAVANPVDLVAAAPAEHYEQALRTVSRDPSVDAIIAIFVPPLVTREADVARAVARSREDAGRKLPIASVFMTAGPRPDELDAASVPVYRFPENAVRALGAAADYAQWRRAPRGGVVFHPDARRDEAAAIIAAAMADGDGWLAPERATALWRCYGLPVADSRLAATPDEAVQAATDLGGEVALKAVAPGLVHKTDAGGVRLGLSGPEPVRAAARAIAAEVVSHDHPAPRFLVQRMADPGVELLVGVVHDPLFGPVLACGAGGTTAELVGDVAVRITPVTDREVHEMVRALKTFPLLDGYRGAPKADVAALEDVLLRISELVEAHPEVAELEANPLIVTAAGAIAVDVRVRLHPVEADAPSPSVDA